MGTLRKRAAALVAAARGEPPPFGTEPPLVVALTPEGQRESHVVEIGDQPLDPPEPAPAPTPVLPVEYLLADPDAPKPSRRVRAARRYRRVEASMRRLLRLRPRWPPSPPHVPDFDELMLAREAVWAAEAQAAAADPDWETTLDSTFGRPGPRL